MWSLDEKDMVSKAYQGALRTAGVPENELKYQTDALIAAFSPNEEATAISEIVRLQSFMESYIVPMVTVPEPQHMIVTVTIPAGSSGATISIALDTYFPVADLNGELTYPQEYLDLAAGSLLSKAINCSKHVRNVAPMMLSNGKNPDTQAPVSEPPKPINTVVSGNVNDMVNAPVTVTKLSVKPSVKGDKLVRRLHGDWFAEHGIYLDYRCKVASQFDWITKCGAGEYNISASVIVAKSGDKNSIIQVF